MRPASSCVNPIIVDSMNGIDSRKTVKMTSTFGTKASVASWICVSAWNSGDHQADHQRSQHDRCADLEHDDHGVRARFRERLRIPWFRSAYG